MWTTIGARLLNLFFRNLVCMSAFYNAFALVGGGWNNGSAGGLWCWNFTELSSAYGVVGARLIIWELMCKSAVLLWACFVGGLYFDALNCGLWFWNDDQASSCVNLSIGARLLIYREMMCMSAVILPIILSAVDMVLVYRLACGVGLWTILRLMLLSISVLDLLY